MLWRGQGIHGEWLRMAMRRNAANNSVTPGIQRTLMNLDIGFQHAAASSLKHKEQREGLAHVAGRDSLSARFGVKLSLE
jgi:hypothetical protein